MAQQHDDECDAALFRGLAHHLAGFHLRRQANEKYRIHWLEAVFSAKTPRNNDKTLEQLRRIAQELIEVANEMHPPARPPEAVPLYYIQDTRSFIGNCPVFWGPDGNGYTTDLRHAGKYTFEKAMRQHFMRDTDLPWLCDEIDAIQRPTVDQQDMRKRSTQQASMRRKATDHGIVRD
jgi:hypothetical protein